MWSACGREPESGDALATIGRYVTCITERTAERAYKMGCLRRLLETAMTLQSFAPNLVAAQIAPRRRTFWRRVIDAVAASRQRRADQEIARHVRRYRRELCGELARDFERELERRLLGL